MPMNVANAVVGCRPTKKRVMCCQVRWSDSVSLRLASVAVVLTALIPAVVPVADVQPLRVEGTLTAVHVDDLTDRTSAGRIDVDTETILVPATVPVDTGEAIVTVQELFAYAPAACRRRHETGLVRSDGCRSELGAVRAETLTTTVRVVAARDRDGYLVASKVTFVNAPGSAGSVR